MGNQNTCYQCKETLPKPPDGKRYERYHTRYPDMNYFHQECLEEYCKEREEKAKFAPNPSRYDSSSDLKK